MDAGIKNEIDQHQLREIARNRAEILRIASDRTVSPDVREAASDKAKELGENYHRLRHGQKPATVVGIAEHPRRGLGDFTESLLSKLGVTEDRYKEFKKRFGYAPNCNCEARKQWMNAVGAWLSGSNS